MLAETQFLKRCTQKKMLYKLYFEQKIIIKIEMDQNIWLGFSKERNKNSLSLFNFDHLGK